MAQQILQDAGCSVEPIVEECSQRVRTPPTVVHCILAPITEEEERSVEESVREGVPLANKQWQVCSFAEGHADNCLFLTGTHG